MQDGDPRIPVGPTEKPVVAVKHASDAVAERVREWFSGEKLKRRLDGDRAVVVEHPEKRGAGLKIKGAGLRGRAIQFGVSHASKLKAPAFDYEGRFMEDVASSHDTAFLGAASFQQVVTEY